MVLITNWLVFEFFGTTSLILAAIYIYFKCFLYDYWRKKGVVYLQPTVPVGNLLSVVKGKESIGQYFQNIYSKNKSNRFFGIYSFHKPTLVIVDPDLIRCILTKEFSSFHDRGNFVNEKVDPLSANLFFLPGSKWKNLRIKLTPTFTSGKIKQMFPTILECSNELTKYLESEIKTEVDIEIKDIFSRFTTDIIMSTAFGISCNSVKNPDNEFRYWGRKIFEPRKFLNVAMFFAPKLLDTFSIPFTDKGVTKFFTNAFKENVTYRKANNVTRYDFVNLLIPLMQKGYVDNDDSDEKVPHISEDTSGKISMIEACAQAFVFFAAGFETSSSTATHALYELAMHLEAQKKVHEEIDRVLEKYGKMTYDGLNEMTYLHKVVSEVLRKHPPVPFLNRVCTKDIDLPTTDLFIPKGTDIAIPILGIQNDPDIYPDPEKFDPERFNAANLAARHPYTYLPFGEGPRICIGMRFGLLQSKLAIISALSKFSVQLGRKTPVPLVIDPGSVVYTAQGGIHLRFERR